MSTRQSKLAPFVIVMVRVRAQSNQGTITGAISDPAGAVVPAALIEVRNSATAVIYSGGTSNTGNYVIAVPADIYEITVTVRGFKSMCNREPPATAAGRNAYAKQLGKPKPKGIDNSLHSTRFRPEKTLSKTELALGDILCGCFVPSHS